jgi:hypothetical protein
LIVCTGAARPPNADMSWAKKLRGKLDIERLVTIFLNATISIEDVTHSSEKDLPVFTSWTAFRFRVGVRKFNLNISTLTGFWE